MSSSGVISVQNIYQSLIEFDGQSVRAIGPLALLNRLHELKVSQGPHPKEWLLAAPAQSTEDLLIRELILILSGQNPLPYKHEELCHCRMVSAEKVHQAIKQGAHSVKDIARTTLAGTGCGSCKGDIEEIIKSL